MCIRDRVEVDHIHVRVVAEDSLLRIFTGCEFRDVLHVVVEGARRGEHEGCGEAPEVPGSGIGDLPDKRRFELRRNVGGGAFGDAVAPRAEAREETCAANCAWCR